tara:strand:+ start:978 stop:1472 length:495 start_codon:yes stop_codon:yes gene_type:complete
MLLVVVVNVGAPYAKYILNSSLLACDYLPMGVFLPFLFVVTLVNPLAKTAGLRALSPNDLAVVFTMSLVGSTLPTFGLTGYLLGTITSPIHLSCAHGERVGRADPSQPPEVIVPVERHDDLVLRGTAAGPGYSVGGLVNAAILVDHVYRRPAHCLLLSGRDGET